MAIKDALKNIDHVEGDPSDTSFEPPKIFLVLSALMVILAVLAYVFEDELFTINFSSNSFIIALIIPIFLALFFLYCYRNKRLAMIMMGRRAELGEVTLKTSGVTYDVFSSSGGVEEKLLQTRRKKSRQTRKQYAKETKSIIPPKNNGSDT
jgi:uncharacterized protein YacL